MSNIIKNTKINSVTLGSTLLIAAAFYFVYSIYAEERRNEIYIFNSSIQYIYMDDNPRIYIGLYNNGNKAVQIQNIFIHIVEENALLCDYLDEFHMYGSITSVGLGYIENKEDRLRAFNIYSRNNLLYRRKHILEPDRMSSRIGIIQLRVSCAGTRLTIRINPDIDIEAKDDLVFSVDLKRRLVVHRDLPSEITSLRLSYDPKSYLYSDVIGGPHRMPRPVPPDDMSSNKSRYISTTPGLNSIRWSSDGAPFLLGKPAKRILYSVSAYTSAGRNYSLISFASGSWFNKKENSVCTVPSIC